MLNNTSELRTISIAFPACILVFAIVSGNLIVIVAVVNDPRLRRTSQNWYIASLAMADLLVGLLVIPFSATLEITQYWIFGLLLCEVWKALDVLFVTASILNLCLISIDRYYSIYNALISTKIRRSSKVILYIVLAWLGALLISVPPLVGWDRKNDDPSHCSLSTDIGYVTYSAIGSFFLPFIIILVVYCRIYVITKKRSANRRRAVERTRQVLFTNQVKDEITPIPRFESVHNFSITIKSDKNMLHPVSPIDDEPEPKLAEKRLGLSRHSRSNMNLSIRDRHRHPYHPDKYGIMKKQVALRKKDLRSTLILGTVVLVFVVCWLPFFSVYVLEAFCCTIGGIVFKCLFWMGYCNSALNPVIYAVLNPDFKAAFRRLLTRRNRNKTTRKNQNVVLQLDDVVTKL